MRLLGQPPEAHRRASPCLPKSVGPISSPGTTATSRRTGRGRRAGRAPPTADQGPLFIDSDARDGRSAPYGEGTDDGGCWDTALLTTVGLHDALAGGPCREVSVTDERSRAAEPPSVFRDQDRDGGSRARGGRSPGTHGPVLRRVGAADDGRAGCRCCSDGLLPSLYVVVALLVSVSLGALPYDEPRPPYRRTRCR